MKVISSVIAKADGAQVNVARVCAQAGVSRQFFYNQLARYRSGGLEALEPKSRRPLSSPNATPLKVEEHIVRLRKELEDAGLDHGATTIQWHLGRMKGLGVSVPAASTIHRILVGRGQVTAQPKKRPKTSWRRFEAPRPNEWWQIDAMDWVIATGLVKIFNIVDDHSRVAARSRCVNEATTVEAWTTFGQAAQVFGLPAGVLSDNGLCFSGKLRRFEVLFESKLRDAGIRPFNGRPYHPQTTGKVERFQQTLKKWLGTATGQLGGSDNAAALRRKGITSNARAICLAAVPYASNPSLAISSSCKPSSMSSAGSTTMNARIKASDDRSLSNDSAPAPLPHQPPSRSSTRCSLVICDATPKPTIAATSTSTTSSSTSAADTPVATPS